MARTAGRQVEVGLGMESFAAPGVAVAEAAFFKWLEFNVQGISEKTINHSARGLREQNLDSFISRKFGRGTMKFIPSSTTMPFILSLLLGSCATASNADGSGSVYDHTFTVGQTNATPRTATLTVKQGATQVQQFLNTVVEKFSLSVQDGFAEASVDFIGQYPGSDTMTASYASETHQNYVNTTAKFGTSLSAAAGNSATPLRSFSLEITNNYALDEAFLFGSNQITSGNLTMGPVTVTGSYSLPFTDTTELAKYLGNTENRALISMLGASIGSAETEEVLWKLGPMVLTKEPQSFPIDGINMIEQEFECRYDSTDKMIQAVVTNLVANATNATYAPA